jgi:hypothetical protein
MEGGRSARGASDGDSEEGSWRRASFYTDQYRKPGINVSEPRPMEGGRRAGGTGNGDEEEGAWLRAVNIMGRAGSFRSNPNIVSRFDSSTDPRGNLT